MPQIDQLDLFSIFREYRNNTFILAHVLQYNLLLKDSEDNIM